MFRGSTPTHNFDLGEAINVLLIETLQIAYAQDGNIVLEKTKEDCTIKDGVITLKLSQDDTLKFSEDIKVVDIQLRIKTINKDVIISDMIHTSLKDCLFDEVI